MAGLTSNGYIARTAGEWFDVAKAEYNKICADLGFSPPRYDKAEFVTAVLLIVAQIASEIDNAVSALFDAHDPNQASGFLLRYLANLAGVIVDEGRKSRVTLTLGAWDNGDVVLTKGEVKAGDGKNVWVLIEDVVIPAGGTTTAVFEATEVGPIEAPANTINKRITGVAGWQTVNNAAAATVGTYAETDASIRNKIAKGQGGTGSRSPLAIRNALSRLPGVQQVRIVFNPKLEPVTVSGRTIPENGVGVWLYPADLTRDVQEQALSLLFAMLPANVQRSLPAVTGADGVVGTVRGADNRPHKEGFWFMTSVAFRTHVQIDPATGYEAGGTLSLVTEPIRQVVQSYFANLGPGEAVRQQDLAGLVAAVAGVARTTIYFSVNGGAWSTDDVELDAATFAALDPNASGGGVTVTEAAPV